MQRRKLKESLNPVLLRLGLRIGIIWGKGAEIMSDFANYIMNYLGRALMLAVPAAAFCGAGLFIASRRYRKKHGGERKFPWGKAVLGVMLVGYLAVLLFVTTARGWSYSSGGANFHLFRAWREAWNSFSEKNWLNVLLNIAVFVPLGVLLPLLWKRFRKWPWMLGMGFLTTLYIECVQYIKGAGLFDVDDLLCNTLGAMLGFWAVMVFLSVWEKKWKRCACHALALLAVLGAIGGIFIAYDVQEYGNLSTSPAFRVNTKDMEWTVSCELDNVERNIAIYRTQTSTKAECEAFGREFLENLGAEDVDVTIYNEEVYLREHQGSRWLEVFYQDGHYSYSDLEDWDGPDSGYGEVSEEKLRAELLNYGIAVPEEADFSYDEGSQVHYFWVNRHVDGDMMMDGTVAVQWEDGYGIREINHTLVTFTYYGEAEVISEQAAVERLMDGWITDGERLERKNIKQIEIVSCELAYQVDTKGFFQPVYLFEMASMDTDYSETAVIPAIK